MENLQIGTDGWRRKNGLESFYPDDLPEDWQLDYFSNAYRVLLVPMQEWTEWQASDLEEVADSVEAPFYFYFAVDHVLDDDILAQLQFVVTSLAQCATGLVVRDLESAEQVKLLNLPVTLVSSEQVLSGWSWQSNGITCSGNPLALLKVLPSDGREQVTVLKAFMESLPEGVQAAPFIVSGEPINMDDVANLKTVAELLGY